MKDGDPHVRASPRPFLLEDPAWPERRARRRRLLRGLALAVVVTAILAVAVAAAGRTYLRRTAVIGVVTEDLERLSRAQTAYRRDRGRFGGLDDLGTAYVASQGVRVWVERASEREWAARAWHLRTDVVCRISGDERGAGPAECG